MKIIKNIVAIFSILILLLSSLYLLAACGNNEQLVTVYQPIASPPVEISIEQLISDYMTDKAAADVKYKGKTFLFTEITVEEVQNNANTYPPPFDTYILSGLTQFSPRYNTGFDYIGKGFVVDIIGKIQGWQFSRVSITDCWVGVVEGDIDNLPTLEY